jgi:hypothetical protein
MSNELVELSKTEPLDTIPMKNQVIRFQRDKLKGKAQISKIKANSKLKVQKVKQKAS